LVVGCLAFYWLLAVERFIGCWLFNVLLVVGSLTFYWLLAVECFIGCWLFNTNKTLNS
jgi:hypothetical protein